MVSKRGKGSEFKENEQPRERDRDFYFLLFERSMVDGRQHKKAKEPRFENSISAGVKYFYDEALIQKGNDGYFVVLRNSLGLAKSVAIMFEDDIFQPVIKSSLDIPTPAKIVDHFQLFRPMFLPEVFISLISSKDTKTIASGFDLCYEFELLMRKAICPEILLVFVGFLSIPICLFLSLMIPRLLFTKPGISLFLATIISVTPLMCFANAFVKSSDLECVKEKVTRIIYPLFFITDFIVAKNIDTIERTAMKMFSETKKRLRFLLELMKFILEVFVDEFKGHTDFIRQRYAQPFSTVFGSTSKKGGKIPLFMLLLYLYASFFIVLIFMTEVVNSRSIVVILSVFYATFFLSMLAIVECYIHQHELMAAICSFVIEAYEMMRSLVQVMHVLLMVFVCVASVASVIVHVFGYSGICAMLLPFAAFLDVLNLIMCYSSKFGCYVYTIVAILVFMRIFFRIVFPEVNATKTKLEYMMCWILHIIWSVNLALLGKLFLLVYNMVVVG